MRQGTMTLEESDLSRLQVYYPDGEIPLAWRPIKYRRRALVTTTHERDSEEKLECRRRVLEVLNVLREADLPFAAKVGPETFSTVAARCCQGLAANTVAKRLRDWNQFRRY